MTEQPQHFRFLDIPRETRNEIYDHALCSFSRRQGPYSVQQYARVHAGAEFEERRFLGTVDLLLVNKQIYEKRPRFHAQEESFCSNQMLRVP
jgi:hypothetical protein